MASDDWQVGDLAVCVDAGPIGVGYGLTAGGGAGLTEGSVWEVARAYHCDLHPDHPLILDLVGDGAPNGRLAARFRKIRPDEQEACEPEFITLLKRSRNRVAA